MSPDLLNSDPGHSDLGRDETNSDSSAIGTAAAGASAAGPTGIHAVFLGPQGVRAGWRAAMYVALFFLFLFILEGLAALFYPQVLVFRGQISPGVLFAQEAASAFCAVCAALVMGRIEGRRFDDYGMPWRGALRGYFWKGALWGIGQITVVVLLIRALGGYSFGEAALGGAEAVEYGLLWAGFFLVVGVFEEFFFRGYLQFTAASGMGFWPAAMLLSVIFGASHLSNPGEGFLGVLDVFLIGMFFCLTLRRTGDLWFAIGFHTTWNFGETYVYSVPNSGIVLPGQLLHASLDGPDWLTGGSVGPEGSVLAFAVTAVTFVAFDRIYRPRRCRQN